MSGITTTLIGGATKDIAPWFSRDGQRFMFVRLVSGEFGAYWVANADGTDARELVRAPVEWVEWSDAGDRIVTTRLLGGPTETSVIDVGSGEATVLDVGREIQHPHWRPGHDQIVFKTSPDGIQSTYYLVNADGSESHLIDGVSPYAVNDPAFSPDGSKMAYASWQNGGEDGPRQGRIHVLDLDSGTDQLLMFDGSEGTNELDPRFSPDGTTLLFERYMANEGGYRLVVAPLDGNTATPIGPVHGTGTGWGAATESHPDGTQVLAVYEDDGAAHLLEHRRVGRSTAELVDSGRRDLAAPGALSTKRHGTGGLGPAWPAAYPANAFIGNRRSHAAPSHSTPTHTESNPTAMFVGTAAGHQRDPVMSPMTPDPCSSGIRLSSRANAKPQPVADHDRRSRRTVQRHPAGALQLLEVHDLHALLAGASADVDPAPVGGHRTAWAGQVASRWTPTYPAHPYWGRRR